MPVLPTAFVVTAEYDPLRGEAGAYAARLAADAVRVEPRRYPGMLRGCFAMDDVLPCARHAVADALVDRRDGGMRRRVADPARRVRAAPGLRGPPAGSSVYAGAVSPLSRSEKRTLLARAPLFAGLSDQEIDALFQVTRPCSLQPRDELFHKGDAGNQVYLVIRGTLKALTTSEEGDDVVFSILSSGELVGEIGFLGTPTRTATVSAITESELLTIDRRDFLAFLKSHPDASIKLLTVLADRLKRVSELVEDTLFLNLPVRLAKKLVHYASIYGDEVEGGVRINLKLSQEEWGDLVGATRESVNKQMRAWTEEGIIGADSGFVVIRRTEALEKLAGCAID